MDDRHRTVGLCCTSRHLFLVTWCMDLTSHHVFAAAWRYLTARLVAAGGQNAGGRLKSGQALQQAAGISTTGQKLKTESSEAEMDQPLKTQQTLQSLNPTCGPSLWLAAPRCLHQGHCCGTTGVLLMQLLVHCAQRGARSGSVICVRPTGAIESDGGWCGSA
jgi:hypothetical protein